MGGFHGHNGLDVETIVHLCKIYISPVADITVNIFTGILPIEAQLYIRALCLFNNICNQLESNIEKSLARRQLLINQRLSRACIVHLVIKKKTIGPM